MDNYLDFCREAGVAQAFPTSQGLLVGFVAWLGWARLSPRVKKDGLAYETVKAYVVAVRDFSVQIGLGDPTVGAVVLERVLRGYKKLKARPVSRKLPVTGPMLEAMAATVQRGQQGELVWAVFTVAFGTLARLGELVPACVPKTGAQWVTVPRWSWLSIVSEDHWVLRLPQSKTDVFRAGVDLHIWGTGRVSCPLKALRAWGRLSGGKPGDDRVLFDAGGGVPLVKGPVVLALRRGMEAIAARFGVTTAGWSDAAAGHSFRRGAATSLLLAGVAPAIVKALGRWTSDSYLAYQAVPLQLMRGASLKAASVAWSGLENLSAADEALAACA